MKCPKCGYQRRPKDDIVAPPTECPSCGVVYAKFEMERLAHMAPLGLRRPSPVDASTLKQARERVERRLRSKAAGKVAAEQRAQTLERARRIFLQQLRNRQLRTDETESPGAPAVLSPPLDETAFDSRQTAADTMVDSRTDEQPQLEPGVTLTSSVASDPVHLSENELRQDEGAPQQPPAPAGFHRPGRPAGRTSAALPLLCAAALVAGVAGSLISWITLSPAGAQTAAPAAAGAPVSLGVLIGFCYLAVGVLGAALFWVIGLLTRRLGQIQQVLTLLVADRDSRWPVEVEKDRRNAA